MHYLSLAAVHVHAGFHLEGVALGFPISQRKFPYSKIINSVISFPYLAELGSHASKPLN